MVLRQRALDLHSVGEAKGRADVPVLLDTLQELIHVTGACVTQGGVDLGRDAEFTAIGREDLISGLVSSSARRLGR